MFTKKCFRNQAWLLAIAMAVLFAISILAATPDTFAAETKTITDMAGRKITVAKEVKRVFGTGASDTVYLYTLAPEKLVGINYEFNQAEKKYIPAKYQNLPVLGNFVGAKTNTNLEALIKAAPHVLVMASSDLGKADKEAADKLQKQTGIPVFIIGGRLEKIPQAYLALGNLMGVQDRAKKLYSYSYHAINGVKNRGIPEAEKVNIYFGNGVKSLDTAPADSSHAEVLALAGAKNVAVIPGAVNRMEVGLEQVIKWNPGVILVNGEPKQDLSAGQAAKTILADFKWSTIKAVKDKRVYSIPKAPYAWVDRPYGPNRIIGLKWVGKTVYPAYYKDINMDKEIKTFYSLFYHLELTDSQVKDLLNN